MSISRLGFSSIRTKLFARWVRQYKHSASVRVGEPSRWSWLPCAIYQLPSTRVREVWCQRPIKMKPRRSVKHCHRSCKAAVTFQTRNLSMFQTSTGPLSHKQIVRIMYGEMHVSTYPENLVGQVSARYKATSHPSAVTAPR